MYEGLKSVCHTIKRAENFTALRASLVLRRGGEIWIYDIWEFRRPVIARAYIRTYNDENVMQRSRNHVRRSHDRGRIASTKHQAIVFLFYGCHATVRHHQRRG